MIHHSWKYPGIFLITAGMALAIYYLLFDFRIYSPVFAIYSYYMEEKFLATFRTNIAEEIILISLLVGFFLLIFSKEKPGKPSYDHLKGKALYRALFWNCIFLFLSILFLHGYAFTAILVVNVFSVFVLYLVIFTVMKRREKKS